VATILPNLPKDCHEPMLKNTFACGLSLYGRHKRCQWLAHIELVCNYSIGAAAQKTAGKFSVAMLKHIKLYKKYFKQQQNMKCYCPGP
jgi:hypothetical protein